MAMHIGKPKSFVAGVLALIMAVKTMFQRHGVVLHNFNLVLLPAVSALCFWHTFMGRRPLLGRSEIHTSIFLGILTLLLALGETFLAARYGHKTFNLLTATLFYAAAVFYFREALQESRSSTASNHS
jgi:hypothetical protein